MELPHVETPKLEVLVDDLARNGTPLGAEREEVVNVTACLGPGLQIWHHRQRGPCRGDRQEVLRKGTTGEGADRHLLLPERLRERAA